MWPDFGADRGHYPDPGLFDGIIALPDRFSGISCLGVACDLRVLVS